MQNHRGIVGMGAVILAGLLACLSLPAAFAQAGTGASGGAGTGGNSTGVSGGSAYGTKNAGRSARVRRTRRTRSANGVNPATGGQDDASQRNISKTYTTDVGAGYSPTRYTPRTRLQCDAGQTQTASSTTRTTSRLHRSARRSNSSARRINRTTSTRRTGTNSSANRAQ